MDYEIVATLGPASNQPSTWKSMLSARATAFRLNTSHLSLEQLDRWLEMLQAFRDELGGIFPLVLDLQGSKWRLGTFPAGILLQEQLVELVYGRSSERADSLPVPHPDFFKAAPSSDGEIILNDDKSRLRIERCGSDRITARVMQGGEISPGKGITLASGEYRKESLNEKDEQILRRTWQMNFIRYAISYVKDAAEMERYRSIFGTEAYLIAKLERATALREAEAIARHTDELWLCRGDLGAEMGLRAMAEAVSQFSKLPARLNLPVLMAGQVLEHMTAQPVPTRSEICYLYDILIKGYRGFVLSDEAAIGRYPVESCRAAATFKH